jgi:hypothetical protein
MKVVIWSLSRWLARCNFRSVRPSKVTSQVADEQPLVKETGQAGPVSDEPVTDGSRPGIQIRWMG